MEAAPTVAKLWCEAEKTLVANIEGYPGKRLDAKTIQRGIKATDAKYYIEADSIRDGVQMLCPRCGNALLFQQPSGKTGIYAVPGTAQFGQPEGEVDDEGGAGDPGDEEHAEEHQQAAGGGGD